MKHVNALISFLLLAALPAAGLAQSGTDINQAIPIYFGQIVNDLGSLSTVPLKVYSITVAKGQQVSATLTSTIGNVDLALYPASKLTIATSTYRTVAAGSLAENYGASASWTYTITTAGTYYVAATFGGEGTHYSLQVNAVGTPLLTPLPAQSGCLTGQVDYLTYSLQLVAADLPDSASIGGTQMCGSCTVKPPAYPVLVDKMEKAMGLGVGVSACYDSSGNIFQLKLIHP